MLSRGIPERVKAERDESGYSKRAEKIIGTWSDTEARIYFGGTEAFYLPEKDEIHVPNREAFLIIKSSTQRHCTKSDIVRDINHGLIET